MLMVKGATEEDIQKLQIEFSEADKIEDDQERLKQKQSLRFSNNRLLRKLDYALKKKFVETY